MYNIVFARGGAHLPIAHALREEKERIMPSLVATTSTPARKPFVRTHYVRTKNTRFQFEVIEKNIKFFQKVPLH